MHVENAIIGAGPAGLQLGHFLAAAGRNYRVFDSASRPGSFFSDFPRHRRLISINKKHNYYSSPSYNLRHDWNSLLSHGGGPLFTSYSDELFPQAGALCTYLEDYSNYHRVQVRFNARVSHISRSTAGVFSLQIEDEIITADRIFMATGALEAVKPDIPGIELARTYADYPISRDLYLNQKVAIVGRGNSAFEIANDIAGHAAIVHILTDRPIKHAWDTHFPGNLRAINNTILDMYQLKSLHAIISYSVNSIEQAPDGKLLLQVSEELPNWDPPVIQNRTVEYDHVIYAIGWRYAQPELFAEDCRPLVTQNGKFFELSPWWETSQPGVFCIGTTMQSRDRVAASGFIHGFRYNIRTLFSHIEDTVYDTRRPRATLQLQTEADLEAAADLLLRRLSTTSALYQQHGVLADRIDFDGTKLHITPELPTVVVGQLESDNSHARHLSMTLEYGFNRYPAIVSSLDFTQPYDPKRPESSAFLHPVFRLYQHGELLSETHLGESIDLRWDLETILPDELLGHKAKVVSILNKAFEVSDDTFDTEYAGLLSTATLRPLLRDRKEVRADSVDSTPNQWAFYY